ncbi:MAG TPA: hypothetical protein VI306_06000 [Pyrinomonadaceae bacterium]
MVYVDQFLKAHASRSLSTCVRIFLFTVLLLIGPATGFAQQNLPKKLPAAEKIVDNYLKAIGGKNKISAIRDAKYVWAIQLNGRPEGTAQTLRRTPSSERWELTLSNGSITKSSSPTSAWEIGLDHQLHTLTGPASAAAKLRAVLEASRFVNFKKLNVLARVVSLGDLASEPAYIVEFSTKSGAKLQYYFSVKTSMITKITDDAEKSRTWLEDYRVENGILEPHRLRVNSDSGDLTYVLQSVQYNVSIAEAEFDPPKTLEGLDVAALLREVGKNQDDVEKRVAEYSFVQKETDREISSKGELKKETVKVYEVFPVANREPVLKLISENGVPLSAEKAAREEKRVQDELEKAERDKDKDERDAARKRADQQKKNRAAGRDEDDDPEISQFLRVCEFVSPRRERYQDRDTIVFDFRPRPGFKPANREESLIAKLVGAMWIDPVDKQVIRLEARLAEGFKMGGGLLVSLKPGAAMIMEQTRVTEGVWLPQFAQFNLSVKVLLFGGGDYNKTIEWSDYKHFSGDVNDYKIEAPKKP